MICAFLHQPKQRPGCSLDEPTHGYLNALVAMGWELQFELPNHMVTIVDRFSKFQSKVQLGSMFWYTLFLLAEGAEPL